MDKPSPRRLRSGKERIVQLPIRPTEQTASKKKVVATVDQKSITTQDGGKALEGNTFSGRNEKGSTTGLDDLNHADIPTNGVCIFLSFVKLTFNSSAYSHEQRMTQIFCGLR
jgi:hypothetical protein